MERQGSSYDGLPSIKVLGKTTSVADPGWWRPCAVRAADPGLSMRGFPRTRCQQGSLLPTARSTHNRQPSGQG